MNQLEEGGNVGMGSFIDLPIQELHHLYSDGGLSARAIAKRFHCSATTVSRRLKSSKANFVPKRGKISIQANKLKQLYFEDKKPLQEIAGEFNCSRHTIIRRLHDFGFVKKAQKERNFTITKGDLNRLYTTEKKSVNEIAKIFGCSYTTVWNRMKEYGIKTRNLSEANALNNLTRKIDIPKSELARLYFENKLSSIKISERCGYSHSAIRRLMEKQGLKRRDAADATMLYPKKEFSGNPIEKAYLVGFRLGDLYVCKLNKKGKTIRVECNSTIPAQIKLVKDLFSKYGHYKISDFQGYTKEKRITCYLNQSFSFLLKKEDSIEKEILNEDKQFFAFLAGYLDAEGHFCTNPSISMILLSSYDKNILHQLWQKLNESKISCPKPRISKPAGYALRGRPPYKKDFWQLGIYSKKSVLELIRKSETFLKHKNKIKSMNELKKNILFRNKKYGNLRM